MRNARVRANRFYRSVRMPSVWPTLSAFEQWMVWDALNSVGSPLAGRVGSQGLDYFPCRYVLRCGQAGGANGGARNASGRLLTIRLASAPNATDVISPPMSGSLNTA